MKRSTLAVPVILLLVAACVKAETDIPDHLQTISVTVQGKRGTGSGVVVKRGECAFVWTAAHVVDDLRRTRTVVDPKSGTTRTLIEFEQAKILRRLVENGTEVGKLELAADVIKYSDADYGEDLALLKLVKHNFAEDGARFYLEDKIPSLGTDLYHVGSLLGEMGSNSMTSGIMSQHGRMIGKVYYDQTTVTAFPGSSGGGVFLRDGKYVGMLVRGAGEGFNLIVPIRRMHEWAKENSLMWALDPGIDVPSEKDLRSIQVEDVGRKFKDEQQKEENKKYPFLIHFPE